MTLLSIQSNGKTISKTKADDRVTIRTSLPNLLMTHRFLTFHSQQGRIYAANLVPDFCEQLTSGFSAVVEAAYDVHSFSQIH